MGDLSAYRENICADCPGTRWGRNSICRIHNQSIGLVTACEQWEREASSGRLDLVADILQQTEEDIRSYQWMLNRIERYRSQLMSGISGSGPRASLVAKYGDDAASRGGQGVQLSELENVDSAFRRKLDDMRKLQEKCDRLTSAMYTITEPKEVAALEGMLAGLTIKQAAGVLDVNRHRAGEIRRTVIKKLAKEMYGI